MRKVTLLCVVFIFTLFAACARKPNDETVAQNIQTKISADPQAQESQVKVEAEEGKVTLKGTAKSNAVRQKIETIAKEQPGVEEVNDQIFVETQEPAPTTKPMAPAVQQAAERTPVPVAPPPKPMVVPAGTVLTIRTGQALGSKTSQVGTAFTGSLSTPVSIEGRMVIPAGSGVTGTVKETKKAGRFKGGAVLGLTIDSITVNGHQYNIETEAFQQTSTGKGKRTAGAVVGGTGAGAAIGGIAGGGKGAAIGAVVGAGAGTIGAMTGNRDINLPAESALSFRLVQPLTLKPESRN